MDAVGASRFFERLGFRWCLKTCFVGNDLQSGTWPEIGPPRCPMLIVWLGSLLFSGKAEQIYGVEHGLIYFDMPIVFPGA